MMKKISMTIPMSWMEVETIKHSDVKQTIPCLYYSNGDFLN